MQQLRGQRKWAISRLWKCRGNFLIEEISYQRTRSPTPSREVSFLNSHPPALPTQTQLWVTEAETDTGNSQASSGSHAFKILHLCACSLTQIAFFGKQKKLSFPEHSFFLLDIFSDDSCFYLLVVDEFFQFIKLGAVLPSQEWEVTRTLWRWKRAMMSSSLFTGLASSRLWSVQGGLTQHTEMCTGDLSRGCCWVSVVSKDRFLSF